MIISGTGHRPQGLFGFDLTNIKYDLLRNEIKKYLTIFKPEKVLSGMAIGYDQILCDVCIDCNIPFSAIIPFKGQEGKWNNEQQDHYFELLNKATEKVIVCEGDIANWKFQKRNEYLVDHCDLLLAAFNQIKSGGTYNCINYAEKQNKKIITINTSALNYAVEKLGKT